MEIKKIVPAFWWFEDALVAGMARPGFNRWHWMNLDIEEAALFVWLGKQQNISIPLETLPEFLVKYHDTVWIFRGYSDEEYKMFYERMIDPIYLSKVLKRFQEKMQILDETSINITAIKLEGTIRFDYGLIQNEIDILKKLNIQALISLNEPEPDSITKNNFNNVYHIPVQDLHPPVKQQVEQFTEILLHCKKKKFPIAIHCIGGLGRTTTMLIASYILQGYDLNTLIEIVKNRNPYYLFKGDQWNFIKKLRDIISDDKTRQ